MSIPDFGLKEGEKDWHIEEYRLNVKIVGIGKISQTWYKPDGKIQKSVPAFVKNTEEHAHSLKKAKAEVKQIQKYVTAQRDRIDRSYLHNRSIISITACSALSASVSYGESKLKRYGTMYIGILTTGRPWTVALSMFHLLLPSDNGIHWTVRQMIY